MTRMKSPTAGSVAPLPPYQQLLEEVWQVTEEAFQASHPGRFLILEVTGAESAGPLTFHTVNVAAVKRGQERACLDVIPVVKRAENNPFSTMITLGRARNNDLVVNDHSVSKMHAWIRLDADTHDGATAATLTDSGSTNGTFVNGIAVVASTVPLPMGARVRLGSVEFWFVDSLLLHRALRRRGRAAVVSAGVPAVGRQG